ncbi:basic proline-rich protein-like [Ursus maritimus]|uniref:Basic proline-rich protein-like n=1 Tax=Ursus maritimus TaxID=29073 RepID=A0A8M1FBS4_URSMA|nr:basic proline-rich protein-like [Ursus maritimus]
MSIDAQRPQRDHKMHLATYEDSLPWVDEPRRAGERRETHQAPCRPLRERAAPRGCSGGGGGAGLTPRPGRPGPRPAPRPSQRPEPAPQQPEARAPGRAAAREAPLPAGGSPATPAAWSLAAGTAPPSRAPPRSRPAPPPRGCPRATASVSREPLTRRWRCQSCRGRRRGCCGRRCSRCRCRVPRLPSATPPPPLERRGRPSPRPRPRPGQPLATGAARPPLGAPARPSRSRQWPARLSFRGAVSQPIQNSPESPFLPPAFNVTARSGAASRSPVPGSESLASPRCAPATSGFNPPWRVQRQLRLPTEGPREPSASAWARDPTTLSCLNRSPWPQLQVPFPGHPAWAASWRQVPGAGPRGRSRSNSTIASKAQHFQAPHRLSLTFAASPAIGIPTPNLPGLRKN